MTVNSTLMHAFKLRAVCSCGLEMKWDGMVLLSDPPQYRHVCLECGKAEILSKNYPCIDFTEA